MSVAGWTNQQATAVTNPCLNTSNLGTTVLRSHGGMCGNLNVLHKLQFFAWRVLLDTLPTRAQLARWDSSISPLCLICRVGDETINHLLIRCPFARSLWAFFPDSILRPASAGSITQWFWHDASDNNRRLGI